MLKRILVPILMLAFATTACGDSLDDKKASELTSDERTEVCEDLADYADSKISEADATYAACVITGETTAAFDTTTTCEEARDACLEDPPETTDDSSDCGVTEATDCDATVDEIKSCMEAQIDQFASFYDTVECGSEASFPTELPSECTSLQEQCPTLFGEGT